jgi:hypothetical protein
VLASIMLVFNVTIGVSLTAQGAAQLLAGVPLSPGRIIAMMLSFAALTLVAAGILMALVRESTGRVDPLGWVHPQRDVGAGAG